MKNHYIFIFTAIFTIFLSACAQENIEKNVDNDTDSSVSEIQKIEVNLVKSISFEKEEVNIEVGEKEKLIFTIDSQNIDNRDPELEWVSSNSNFVTVDNTGEINAVAIGQASIMVKTKDGSAYAITSVKVAGKSVKGISLTKNKLTLEEGKSQKLEVMINPSDAANKNVIWSSSNPTIAEVDHNGTVVAKAAGTVEIVVETEDGGLVAKCKVTVKKKPTPKSTTNNTNKSTSNNTKEEVKSSETNSDSAWKVKVSGSNSPNNYGNYGFLTKVGEWLFYYSEPDSAIFKIKVDGTSKTKIKSVRISSMIVKDDYIYYSFYAGYNERNHVYRMTHAGKDVTLMSNFISRDYSISVDVLGTYKENLYYKYWGSIHSVRLDLSNGEILAMQPTRPRYTYLWGDRLYYTNTHEGDSIYTMNLDTEEISKINSNKSAMLNIQDNVIYYSNRNDSGHIYKVSNGNDVKVANEIPYSMNVYNDWIYYTNSQDGNKLYKIKTDGTGKTKITDDTAFHMNVVGDWIYYQTSAAKEVFLIKNDGSIKYKLSEK